MKKKLLRIDEVATRLNISVRTVYRLVETAELDDMRIRNTLRVVESSIDPFIRRQISIFQEETGIR